MVYVSGDGSVNTQLSPLTVTYWKNFIKKAIDFVVLFFQTLLEPFLEFANKNSGGSSSGKKSAWKGSGSSMGGGDGRGGGGPGGKPNIHGLKHRSFNAPPPGG